MKRTLMSIMLLALGWSVEAGATDISDIENTVYVEPLTVNAGSQQTLSVRMKNTVAITGYEFYMQLPDGMTFATDEDDFLMTELSTARTTAKKTSFFDSMIDQSGELHVLCSTTAEDPNTGLLYAFSGNDGEVCRVTIDVPATMTSGEYTIVLKNVVLTPPTADASYETERVEVAVTVEGKTDSSIENMVYVEPLTVNAGSQQTLSVRMKNTVAITGYEFYMQLPDGMTFATDEDNFLMAELSTARTTAKKTSFFDSTIDQSGELHVLCSTTAEDPNTGLLYAFSGNDGEVCRVTIDVPATMTSGEYTIVLKNVVLTPPTADASYETERVEVAVTVESKTDSRTILDETSTIAPEASEGAVNVRVRRTIVGGEWNTICLPFAMSETQTKGAFGEDCQLADFIGCETTEDADENIVGITVHFDMVKAIEANHPYLIKVTDNVKEFTADGVTIAPDEASVDMDEYVVGKGKTKQTYYNSFVGNYVADTTVPSMALFVSANKFWYSTGRTKIGGFRGYFDFYNVLTDVENKYAEVKACFHGEATGIEDVKGEGLRTKDGIYSLSGQRVARAQKGVYIINGKKILK